MMRPLLQTPAARLARTLLAAGLAVLLGACSTARPWLNQPITGTSPAPAALVPAGADGRPHSIIGAVTLSGGGARAAAFGLGVLKELKATGFAWEGRQTTLMDEMGLVSGVSGGSVLATYYVAFGDETFTRFEPDFLMQDFQAGLIAHALSPRSLYRISSPWYGRSNLLAEKLDKLYRGKTFADLQSRRIGPRLLVTASDLTTGAPFEFTPEQFALICSDLNSVPLSFAVAASSSVPLLLSPVTVRNYAGSCPQSRQAAAAARGADNLQARLLHASVQSYLDAAERPYLHLADGGLIDNLGVRGLLVRTVAGGSLDASFQHLPAGAVRKIVLISVNSERDIGSRIDRSARVPDTGQVLDALVFGAGSRATGETLEAMSDSAQRWREELEAVRGTAGSPFAADADIHIISVSLRDVHDPKARSALLQVPTALTILPVQVDKLQEAGRAALRSSAEFQRLRASLADADAGAPEQGIIHSTK
ncbi:patatin-like phospholipase family protein [Massilia polaris]|uniref:patatin-like phospholipase family protein n=1 Tax=Massilia polaris TaxID=2728846 RepID=UPI001E551B9D|nr:patatin-like phospholipase family protein [Massilia polaris]